MVQLSFRDVSPGLPPKSKLLIITPSISTITAFNSVSLAPSMQQAQDMYLLNERTWVLKSYSSNDLTSMLPL